MPKRFLPGRPTSLLTSQEGYLYHATNEERAEAIACAGLFTHLPYEYTDQDAWPDGSLEGRIYFTRRADTAWCFAPEDGSTVILRVPEDAGPFRREASTGDFYSRLPVSPHRLEILSAEGAWVDLQEAFGLLEPDLFRGTEEKPVRLRRARTPS